MHKSRHTRIKKRYVSTWSTSHALERKKKKNLHFLCIRWILFPFHLAQKSVLVWLCVSRLNPTKVSRYVYTLCFSLCKNEPFSTSGQAGFTRTNYQSSIRNITSTVIGSCLLIIAYLSFLLIKKAFFCVLCVS